MSTDVRVIGVDPGPIPGIVLLRFNSGPFGVAQVVQCSHGVAPLLFEAMLDNQPETHTLVQVERFVVGRASMRAGRDGEVTRDLIGALDEVVLGKNARIVKRSASAVKPWAVDERLEAAGLLEATKGMRHARDAARHALFAACHDGGIPDPLSQNGAHR